MRKYRHVVAAVMSAGALAVMLTEGPTPANANLNCNNYNCPDVEGGTCVVLKTYTVGGCPCYNAYTAPAGTQCGSTCAPATCDGSAPSASACKPMPLAPTSTSCGSSGTCQPAGHCDGAGNCFNPPAAVGTACSDGNACTYGDKCNGTVGGCTGTSVTCTSSACVQQTCNGTATCTSTNVADGTVCKATATTNGTCHNGGCAVSSVTGPITKPTAPVLVH